MKRNLLLLLVVLVCNTAFGQLETWELSTQAGNQASNAPTTIGTGITSGILQRGAGVTAAAAAGSMNSSGWFNSAAATTLAQAITNNEYYEFTLPVQACYNANITTVQIVLRSSNTGPNTATLRSSADGYMADLGTVTVTATAVLNTINVNLSNLVGTVTFRLYGYGGAAGGGTPATGGSMRIGTSVVATDNDLVVNGTTTLLPFFGAINLVDGVICTSGTGAFEVNMTGGTSPYSVVYNNGSTNTTVTNYVSGADIAVGAGTYTLVSVTDANGCTATVSGTATIVLYLGPNTTTSVNTNPSCSNNDGDINLTATGGVAPYTYDWADIPGSSDIEDRSNLSAGTYTVVITDALGCSFAYSTTLSIIGSCCNLTNTGLSGVHCENNNMSSSTTDDYIWFQLNPTGTGFGSGYNVTVSSGSVLLNGTTPATNVPYGSSQLFRLQAGSAGSGNVTITVTDAGSSSCLVSVLVVDPGSCSVPVCDLVISGIAVVGETCPGNNNGSLVVTASCTSCGMLQYSKNGTTWQSSNTFSGLAPGVYVVFVRDATNTICSASAQATVLPGDGVPPYFNQSPLPQSATYQCTDIIPAPATLTASDNVDMNVVVAFSSATIPGTCPQAYTVVRTWTATDDCGNQTVHTQTIAVVDTTPPVMSGLPNVTLTLECDQPLPSPAVVTATDNCDVTPTIVLSQVTTPGACPQEYTLRRTWTASDDCGNATSFVQTITVTDNTAPVFSQSLPQNYTANCGAPLPMPEVLTGTDNCDPGVSPSVIFINEIHYDNVGTDVGEFIEVAGTAGTDLSQYQIVLYNGTGGTQYGTLILSGIIDNEGGGFGAVSFPYPVNGLQNGAPDGFAFATTSGMVLQFLSYEGTFTGVGGIADGMLSTDIGVLEDGINPLGTSLQLTGTGQQYSNYNWVGPVTPASPGTLNVGQTITALPSIIIAGFSQSMFPGTCNGESILTRMWTLADACGNAVSHTQTITLSDNSGPAFVAPLPQNLSVNCQDPVPAPVNLLATDACDMGNLMTNVWINEIHYDNTGLDVAEFVEIAGTAGTDLSQYSLVMYNGGGGAVYDTDPLVGTIPNLSNGFGTVCLTYPLNGIQNGSPDGVALVHNVMGGMVVQFLSYEGTFVAVGGPANGMTSTDIGVLEDGTNLAGTSLRLSGTGNKYSDFVWNAPAASTNCTINTGQSFIAVPTGPVVTFAESSAPGTCPQERTITRTWTAMDDCGNVNTHTQVVSVVDDTPPTFTPPLPQNLTLSCQDVVPAAPTLTATDNCDITPTVTYSQVSAPGGCPQSQIITRTWQATDDCGNTNTYTQVINLVDNTPPVLNCPPGVTLNLDIFGRAVLNSNTINVTATDNCSGSTQIIIVVAPITYDCDDDGMTFPYVVRATDACNNMSSCTIQVTIPLFERCTPKILISDPCVCKNNATTLTDGQFGEKIKIESLAGKSWTVIANTGLYLANSASPPAAPFLIPIGTTFTENPIPSGDYFLQGIHVDAQGYSITVRSESGEILTIGNGCSYPNPTISSDLSGVYCLYSGTVALTGTPGDNNIASQQFTVNGVPATQFNPAQGVGEYVITYTVDGGLPKAFGPNDPGCVQTVSTTVHVLETPEVVQCNDLVFVSLDGTCVGAIEPDDVLEGTYGCFDDYLVELDRTLPMGNGPWTTSAIDASDIGKTYQTRVTHQVSGNKCWGLVTIQDKLIPSLVCKDIRLACPVSTYDPTYLKDVLHLNDAFPTITDCSSYTSNYVDTWFDLPCGAGINGIADLSAYVQRKWAVTDQWGNATTCLQYLYFERRHAYDVKFPANYTQSCSSNVSTDPAVTGTPYLTGFGLNWPINPGAGFCELQSAYVDQIVPVCDGTYKIVRKWTLLDWCLPLTPVPPYSNPLYYVQEISVVDQTGPALTCPANLTVSVDPFQCCATVNLPDVVVEDACSRINNIGGMVTTFDPYTGVQTGMYTIGGTLTDFPGNNWWDRDTLGQWGTTSCLPVGVQTVTYRAQDDCDNVSSCTFKLTVVDLVPPVASCDQTTTVAIGPDDPNDCYTPANGCAGAGVTWVDATTFNDGSYDICNNIKVTVRRMAPYTDGINNLNHTPCYPSGASEYDVATAESDSIKFYCSEVGTTQTVILRVYQIDADGNLLPGIDGTPLFNECMVQLEVQDKLKPICQAPANVTVTCEQFDPSLWLYGKANVLDNCSLDETKVFQGQCGLTHAANYAQFDTLCNKGTITRTFRAFDAQGQSSQCTQRVVVTYEQDYYVKFPNDAIVTTCDGTGVYGEPTFYGEDCELLGVSHEDEIFTVVPDACFKIERNWKIINWCTFNPNATCINVPNPNPNAIANHPTNLPGPIVSPIQTVGDPWKSTIVKINSTDASTTNYSTFYDANANCYTYKQIIKIIDTQDPIVECPVSPATICDITTNDAALWNESYWWDNTNQTHDLSDAPSDICITATDACSGANINIEYQLFLDLDGDGTMETVVNSTQLGSQSGGLGWNNVLFGNTSGAGISRQFDGRAVPTNQKWGFSIQETVTGVNKTACVKFNTFQAQNSFVTPQLPYGTHKIKWFVSDGCGNETICEYSIIVKDCKAPTVVCLNGLSVNIMPTGMIQMWATDFLQYAEDNYTQTQYLKYAIRKCGQGAGFPVDGNNNPITNVTFNCSELGTQCVELWALDLAGNADYCETYIIVQDNAGSCDVGTTVNVSGALKTEGADGVEEGNVNITGSVNFAPPFSYFGMTNNAGIYAVSNAVPLASSMTITPVKDDNPLNGVTTYDLVLISKHILGIQPLGSPYKMIAADANKSNSITTFDIVELRKLVLGVYQELPNNTSWRFVDKSHTFANPANPFQGTIPENISVADAMTNQLGEDFVGVKIGDVNNTAVANSLMALNDRTNGTLLFDVNDRDVKAGEAVEVSFTAAEKTQGYQMTLNLNGLTVTEIMGSDRVTANNFGVFADALTVSVDGSDVFTVKFRATKTGKLSEMLSVSSRITKAEGYNLTDGRMEVALRFDGKTIAGVGFELYQNQPNPFVNKTAIGFHLPEATTATLTVYDETGRVVFTQKGEFAKGYNALSLDRALLNTTGILYYTLETATDSATKKMIQTK